MILQTKRLLLRPLTLNDLETKHDYAKDHESNKYMLFLPKLIIEETLLSLQNALHNWENNNPDNYEFAIVYHDIHIGEIGLYRLNNEEAELGWVLHKDYQNKGFVTEAAIEIKNLARKLGFKKLIAHCDEENIPSRKVMEKIGMQQSPHKGVRKNKISTKESVELLYELNIDKLKVGFICVHNSCRSQIAEALSKLYISDYVEAYSAGTHIKSEINKDAVRLVKERFSYDMSLTQKNKLINEIPTLDMVITMGCNVECPFLPSKYREDWGLDDPSGKDDNTFNQTIDIILNKVLELKMRILSNELK